MWEFIGLTLAGLAALGALVLGLLAWRDARRKQDAAGDIAPLSSGGKGEER